MLGIVFFFLSSAGIHETIHNIIIIIKCHVDMHKDMYVNINVVLRVSGCKACFVVWLAICRKISRLKLPRQQRLRLLWTLRLYQVVRVCFSLLVPAFSQQYIETSPAIINKKCSSLGMKYSNPSMQSLIFFVKLTAIRLLLIDNLFHEENENYRRITTLAF